MTDDPRDILKAAGVECAEVQAFMDAYGRYEWTNLTEADAAILALARLLAKYKSAYEAERGRVLRGATGDEWVRRDLAEEEIAKYKWQLGRVLADEVGVFEGGTDEWGNVVPDDSRELADLDRRWEEHCK